MAIVDIMNVKSSFARLSELALLAAPITLIGSEGMSIDSSLLLRLYGLDL